MKQKIIWMHCLHIGISLVFILLFAGCYSEVDCNVISNFTYINNTSYTIETEIGIINPNSKIFIKEEGLGTCNIKSDEFVPPFLGNTKVIFDNIKCLTYQSGEEVGLGEGIIGIDNYVSNKISNNHYNFTYTFTEEEYNKAVDCE
ncbi:hypothetical protein [Tenacibaculum finnmarkense]|uniref:hypothetical protein n=1 Tax=Tenacibaculum finnmarkense TaxID=2781243 RepID=UPI00187B58EF|nr:hypothetical protein [Tenacibaculum finnmarkense]MBE7648884.1 hypothetical protein [Tenacibaculum finnmarkense genomovar ulcerans]MBE7689058.1 hypothetical protein [Tenacibaculum finnmarkense genomovar ulcerans]MCD8401415.1 hypothetical protein [Tenacibaculum finnmarkense genomovar ulcerans]MCD8411124.1 hypothetical protein [Tenacibaculum finnmarkense genomovar ulcerans]MCD8423404.1 hypothetical protein [Tenacibaculum finnmarkense genomovar ulcerans]